MNNKNNFYNKQYSAGTAQFCECEEPIQINCADDRCCFCGLTINFRERAGIPAPGMFDYVNLPENWLF